MSSSSSPSTCHDPRERFSVMIGLNERHDLPVRIMSYNVNQSIHEEKDVSTKWSRRKDRVVKVITTHDPDILCLQELRNLPNNDTNNQFLSQPQLSKYQYNLEYRNPHSMAFGQAILYKPDKFFPLQTVKRWISTTPMEVSDSVTPHTESYTPGYLLQGMQFRPVLNNKIVLQARDKPFWVFCVHLGLDEQVKSESCKLLGSMIQDIVKGEPFIVAGDFNTFPDRDADKQRGILKEYLWADIGELLGMTTSRNHKPITGTFVGFERDAYKAADMQHLHARLDHIWTSSFSFHAAKPLTVITDTGLEPEPEELSTRDLPSDHLPILTTLFLSY